MRISVDFGIGKGLTNLPPCGRSASPPAGACLTSERISHDPAAGAAALDRRSPSPVTGPAGTRIAGMPLASPRVQALLAALCAFRLLPHGFTNRDLRNHLAPLLAA